ALRRCSPKRYGRPKDPCRNTSPVGAYSTTLPTYHADFAKSTASKPTPAWPPDIANFISGETEKTAMYSAPRWRYSKAPDEFFPSPIFVSSRRRCRRAFPAHRRRTSISCPAGACDRAVRARRSDRRIRPPHGAEALRAVGGAVLCREYRRRGRKYWGGSRRAVGTR